MVFFWGVGVVLLVFPGPVCVRARVCVYVHVCVRARVCV